MVILNPTNSPLVPFGPLIAAVVFALWAAADESVAGLKRLITTIAGRASNVILVLRNRVQLEALPAFLRTKPRKWA
jgi:hypothetical protein